MTEHIPEDESGSKLDSEGELKNKLNQEASKIPWHELQRFYAAGMVIVVDPSMDLLEVACQFADDNKAAVVDWLKSEKVSRVDDQQAGVWYENAQTLWAVVIAPWVLVQEIN